MIRVVVLLVLPACAFGLGASTVGEWRRQRVVESTACIETSPGVCGKIVEIASAQPARSFTGGLFTYGAPGYAYARTNGQGESAFVLDGSYEYLKGRGNFALGCRIGLTLLDGSQHSWVVMPVTALGYYGGRWGAVFVGAGYAPLAAASRAGAPTAYFHDGIEALVGTRVILRQTLASYLTVSPELRYQRAGDTTIIAVTANIGLHL